MKSLISINYKFMSLSPKELVELISKTKYTKGLEVYVDINNPDEMKYLDDLVFEIKKNDLILQIHGNVNLEINEQINFIKLLEKYSDYLGYPVVLTLHSIYDEDENLSLLKTSRYISELIGSIDNNKIIICLENLNDSNKVMRLEKEKIRTMILNDEALYFTYDIGHEIADSGKITNMDKYMIEDIRNVHIHSIDDVRVDHMPIYKNDKHWNEIIKGLTFLKLNNYKYNIVFEYGLEYCSGTTKEEKIMDYLNSIDLVSQHFIY